MFDLIESLAILILFAIFSLIVITHKDENDKQ